MCALDHEGSQVSYKEFVSVFGTLPCISLLKMEEFILHLLTREDALDVEPSFPGYIYPLQQIDQQMNRDY